MEKNTTEKLECQVSAMLKVGNYKAATNDLLDIDHEDLSSEIVNALSLHGPMGVIPAVLIAIFDRLEDKIEESTALAGASKKQLQELHKYIESEIVRSGELSWANLSQEEQKAYDNEVYKFLDNQSNLLKSLKSLEKLIERIEEE